MSSTGMAEGLEAAWQAALERDHRLLAAQSRLAAANTGIGAARATRRPSVSVGTSATRFDETIGFDLGAAGVPGIVPIVPGRSVTMSQAQLMVPVYSGGAIAAGIDAAESTADVRAHEAAALVQSTRLAVARSYVDVLRARSALEATESSTASLAAHARDAESRFASGEVPRNDVLASQVALADAEQRELRARNALDIARSAYNRRLDRALTAPVSLETELPPVDPRLESNEPGPIVELALASRSELAALEASAAALEARSQRERAATRPQLDVSGGYTYLENAVLDREDFWSVGLSLRWNLFDGGRSRESAEALSLEAAAVSEERVDLESRIALEVREAWLGLGETRSRVAVTRDAVAQAEENLRVARDRYRFGEGTNTEVLDAEALRMQSRSNFDDARYDEALAGYSLARAAGVL